MRRIGLILGLLCFTACDGSSADQGAADAGVVEDGAADTDAQLSTTDPNRNTMLTVSLSPSGGGTVTSSPSGINCGPSSTSCSASYARRTTVTLTAVPAPGYTFKKWEGGCTGSWSACEVTLLTATTVTAVFNPYRTLTVATTPSGGGTVASSPSAIDCGTTCTTSQPDGTTLTLTATPSTGYTFSGWSGDCTGTSTCSVTLNANKSATATFAPIPTNTVTVSISPTTAAGTVSSDPAGISCPGTCEMTAFETSDVTLTAAAADWYQFVAWSGDCDSTSESCLLDFTADRSVTATFRELDADLLAIGLEHSCHVTRAGGVACWGWNSKGQLGDGTTVDRNSPVTVTGVSGVRAVAAGEQHTCALLASGTVKCWGDNDNGQLGNGSSTNSLTPVDVTGLSDVAELRAGRDSTCARLTSGGVRCWGSTVFGQLGDGGTGGGTTPVTVSGITDAVKISTGGFHSCAVLSTGQARCWGYNTSGQLGDGTSTSNAAPVTVSGITTATDIAAGGSHSCAVLASGQAMCWGNNTYGQLASVSETGPYTVPRNVVSLSDAAQIVAAGEHSCARKSTGSLVCWGSHIDAQIGVGTTCNTCFYPVPTTVVSISDGLFASGIGTHTCAILKTGAVYCWGSNLTGQVGTAGTADVPTPTVVTLP